MPRTMFVWICREESTLAALQGLVETLEGQNGLRYATIKILTVNESRGIEIPGGAVVPMADRSGLTCSPWTTAPQEESSC